MRMDHRRTINNTSNATVNPCALLRERMNDLKKNDVESNLIPLDKAYAGFRAQSPSPEMTRYAVSMPMLDQYKPAMCAGRPSRIPVPFRM